MEEAWSRWSDKWETIWNIVLGVNTKSVLGLPWAKQIGLEHGEKNLRRCERWAVKNIKMKIFVTWTKQMSEGKIDDVWSSWTAIVINLWSD